MSGAGSAKSGTNILSLIALPQDIQDSIRSAGPGVTLTIAAGQFDGEIRETWPAFTTDRYMQAAPDSPAPGTRADRDALLAAAEVVLVGFPFPLDLRARAPALQWVHQKPAGASNMLRGDLWASDVTVTSSRGYAHNLPIAEYALAGILHFAKGFHTAERERSTGIFNAPAYDPQQLAGKVACIIGAGGIGREVGRLCAALGMRVVGTRRTPEPPAPDSPFSEIRGPDGLHALLGEADYSIICCQWTPETEKLLDHAAFTAMKPGATLINIARGEIIDEEALIAALTAGRLRGAALDVYVGEFDHAPNARLRADPRVLITPHISAASDINSHQGNALFVTNLERWLTGAPLHNVIDWDRGY